MALEINWDLKHGAPVYALVSKADGEQVRRLRGLSVEIQCQRERRIPQRRMKATQNLVRLFFE